MSATEPTCEHGRRVSHNLRNPYGYTVCPGPVTTPDPEPVTVTRCEHTEHKGEAAQRVGLRYGPTWLSTRWEPCPAPAVAATVIEEVESTPEGRARMDAARAELPQDAPRRKRPALIGSRPGFQPRRASESTVALEDVQDVDAAAPPVAVEPATDAERAVVTLRNGERWTRSDGDETYPWCNDNGERVVDALMVRWLTGAEWNLAYPPAPAVEPQRSAPEPDSVTVEWGVRLTKAVFKHNDNGLITEEWAKAWVAEHPYYRLVQRTVSEWKEVR